MNIYVNINGKTRYFKSREEADKALGKKPANGNGKKPAESEGKKPAESEGKKPAESEGKK